MPNRDRKRQCLQADQGSFFRWGHDALGFSEGHASLFGHHHFEDIELYPDVIPSLDALRSRFSLGLISNGNGYSERGGLPDYIDFTVFSQDVGVDKPDPRMFLEASRQAHCNPSDLMHVGGYEIRLSQT